MYDKEVVERLLPGVCWTHFKYPARSETGRAGHTCNRNEDFWAAPPMPKPKSSVDPAQYRDVDWPTAGQLDDMDERSQKKWKSRIEAAIDPGKRKSFSNPKHANSIWAELIDVQRGWDEAGLTDKERAALFLRYGMYWKEDEIAVNQGVTQPTISERISNALAKILTFLNGVEQIAVENDIEAEAA